MNFNPFAEVSRSSLARTIQTYDITPAQDPQDFQTDCLDLTLSLQGN